MSNDPQALEPIEVQEEEQVQEIDLLWVMARLTALLYFIEHQYGEEVSATIEHIAGDIETKIRGDVE